MVRVRVAELQELKGGTKVVRVNGKSVAIFRVGDEYFALDNVCLHRGGPLGEGSLEGFEVICPWHGWTYDVRNGALKVIPTLKVKTYPVEREGNGLFLALDGPAAVGDPSKG